MTQLTKDILASILMGLILPGILLNFASALWNGETKVVEFSETEQTEPPQRRAAVLPVKIRGEDGRVDQGDMDAYLVGVVLAEMPACFEAEALKAQAVVARTYARKAYVTGGKHGDGSICTQPSCCQAYKTETDYLKEGGLASDAEKVRSAVYATSAQVLTYGEELIEATYFSCSGGRTEDAVAVWGTDFPYLQAVDSPGEEDAASYEETRICTKAELEEKLGISLGEDSGSWVGPVTRTAGDGVDTMVIGGIGFTGVELRQKLGLRSTAITVRPTEEGLAISTRGFGHRVGMSQYGADAMAAAGHTYEEILAHYYPGTELICLEEAGSF